MRALFALVTRLLALAGIKVGTPPGVSHSFGWFSFSARLGDSSHTDSHGLEGNDWTAILFADTFRTWLSHMKASAKITRETAFAAKLLVYYLHTYYIRFHRKAEIKSTPSCEKLRRTGTDHAVGAAAPARERSSVVAIVRKPDAGAQPFGLVDRRSTQAQRTLSPCAFHCGRPCSAFSPFAVPQKTATLCETCAPFCFRQPTTKVRWRWGDFRVARATSTCDAPAISRERHLVIARTAIGSA